jgi:membrane-associated phospholipid phosphatase
MEDLHQLGLVLIRWLQATFPQWEGFFRAVSALGSEEFFLVALPLVYWTLNKRLGRQLGVLFFLSFSLNVLLKQAFRQPRPFWLDESVGLERTPGYGLPSGHVQNATVLYLLFAAWLRRPRQGGHGGPPQQGARSGWWVWLLAVVSVMLVGLSRTYLGSHFIFDTFAGLLIGSLILLLFAIWQRRVARPFGRRILGQRLLLALLIPLLFAAVFVGLRLALGPPDLSVAWSSFVPEAELNSITDMTTAVAATLGFFTGILFESSRVRFRHDGPAGKRVLRYLLGVIVAIAIWRGLGVLFPSDPLWLALPLRFLRYALLTFWASFLAPLLFVRLRLAAADPAPQIHVGMRSDLLGEEQ